MDLAQKNREIKAAVKASGFDIYDDGLHFDHASPNIYFLTIEFSNTIGGFQGGNTSDAEVKKQYERLKKILAQHGLTQEMFSHQSVRVGRGKAWYSLYAGVKKGLVDALFTDSESADDDLED